MAIRSITDYPLKDQRVLIREDLNVPIKDGKVINEARINAALPTIRYALEQGAAVLLMSHLGRPEEGVAISDQIEFSMAPVAARLAELLGQQVDIMSADFSAEDSQALAAGSCVLLENVRTNVGEKSNADDLASYYAGLCDIFVMDAFGTAHRAQASTHGVAKFADKVCAGPLLKAELDALHKALSQPLRPMLAIVGGAKVSSKLKVLQALSHKVDQLIVGGGIANTFLAAAGLPIGKSLVEEEMIPVARSLMAETDIPLPIDVMVAKEFSEQASATLKAVADVAEDDMILDVGPETSQLFTDIISGMQTILWNGPVGVFEFDAFSLGTENVSRAIAANNGFSIAGGGETITAIDKFGIRNDISYISTGGGAFLEFVQGEVLPAVAVLEERSKE
ncbi:MAG: phosphoglycerate kinase [Gammaproteobacteria bacterium]|jgi:phosphoglycerate kinase|nr:phosphoglycerate kinase [Gammaproteobacteria bacterium]MBT6043169.1 phosphoglycerate kinase [Gammaproteobacteria bacterium]